MSQSLASAKKRRAGIQPNDPVANSKQMQTPGNNGQQQSMQNGLTLAQVIQVVDKRLIILESFMKETKAGNVIQKQVSFSDQPQQQQYQQQQTAPVTSDLQEIIDEFDKRYEMLAEEIVDLKNIVLSLQSYTMDVNKMLLEERGITSPEVNTENSAKDVVEQNVNMSLSGMTLESISMDS